MGATDQSEATRAYYDRLGDAEDVRLTKDIPGRVSFEVHRRFLSRFIKPGDRVLEIGAGTGRFTRVLAELGATVVVTDLSPVQLELNQEHLAGTPTEAAVESRQELDVCDTSQFESGMFDAVVAYGGPLSYAFEKDVTALEGLLRLVPRDGVVVASVMSTLGTWRAFLPGVVRAADVIGEDANDQVLRTGDLRLTGQEHACRMYRSSEVVALVNAAGGRVEAHSGSNWASLGDTATLERLEADPDRWARFLEHEVDACERGGVDGGTHIMFAAKPQPR